jgi:hypothetical protein
MRTASCPSIGRWVATFGNCLFLLALLRSLFRSGDGCGGGFTSKSLSSKCRGSCPLMISVRDVINHRADTVRCPLHFERQDFFFRSHRQHVGIQRPFCYPILKDRAEELLSNSRMGGRHDRSLCKARAIKEHAEARPLFPRHGKQLAFGCNWPKVPACTNRGRSVPSAPARCF